eukprot:6205827-Pleurochrysis_carterae.AAC.3
MRVLRDAVDPPALRGAQQRRDLTRAGRAGRWLSMKIRMQAAGQAGGAGRGAIVASSANVASAQSHRNCSRASAAVLVTSERCCSYGLEGSWDVTAGRNASARKDRRVWRSVHYLRCRSAPQAESVSCTADKVRRITQVKGIPNELAMGSCLTSPGILSMRCGVSFVTCINHALNTSGVRNNYDAFVLSRCNRLARWRTGGASQLRRGHLRRDAALDK